MPQSDRKNNMRIHIENPYEDEDITVYFIGDVTFNDYMELEYHRNPGYEICLIPYGKGVFKIQDNTYPIGIGQIFMTKASQVHAGWPSKQNPYRILYFCFDIKQKKATCIPFWNEIKDRLNKVDHPVTYDRFNMDEIHYRALDEVQKKDLFSSEMAGSLVKQLITLTVRNFEKVKNTDSSNMEHMENQLANQVIQYINEHIYENINLKEISAAVSYSVSYICQSFKNQTGFSIMEYYNFARLEKAREYLVLSCESISRISETLGYKSIHHFSNAFKSFYGSSPAKYRNLYTKNEQAKEMT